MERELIGDHARELQHLGGANKLHLDAEAFFSSTTNLLIIVRYFALKNFGLLGHKWILVK